jgi:thiol-disulfide isomerase/thioredoxin
MVGLVQLDLTRVVDIYKRPLKEGAMKTQHARLYVAIPTLLLATTLLLVNVHHDSTFQAAQAGHQTVGSFKLQNVAGGFMTSEDLKDKVTVVDIWAPWCEWCVGEIPIYNRLYDAFEGHDFALVGIAVEAPRRDIESKVRQLGMKYPILIGSDEALQAFGPVQGFPSTFVISKEGQIYKHYTGAVPQKEERLKQDIQHLLGEESR